MLNFYLKRSFDKELVSNKKLLNYGRYLTELHNMINSWLEKKRQNNLYKNLNNINNIVEYTNLVLKNVKDIFTKK